MVTQGTVGSLICSACGWTMLALLKNWSSSASDKLNRALQSELCLKISACGWTMLALLTNWSSRASDMLKQRTTALWRPREQRSHDVKDGTLPAASHLLQAAPLRERLKAIPSLHQPRCRHDRHGWDREER